MSSDARVRYRKRNLVRSGLFDSGFWELRVDQKLAVLALVLSPFQYALTLDLGFPLKASEVLVVGAFIARVIALRRHPVKLTVDLYLVGAIAVLIAISFASVFIFQDIGTPLPGVERSPVVDLGLYTLYGLFALFTWLIVREVPAVIAVDALLQASWLCFVAVVVQALFWFLKIPWVLEDFGFFMGQQGWRIFDVALARSGPFLEGQHLGFFAGAMFIVAVLRSRYVTAVVLLVCIVYSRSTTAFAGIVVAFVVVSLLRPTRRVLISWAAVVVFSILALFVVPGVRSYFALQLAKFGVGDTGRETRSLEVRSEKTEVGFRMMLDHFPFGVGPGRFSAYYFDYTDGVERASDARESSGRPLVENGYLHIGSELGLFALVVTIVLLAWWLYRLGRGRPWATAMAVFVYVGIATQSSWTFGPIWLFLGVIAAAADSPVTLRPYSRKSTPSDGMPVKNSDESRRARRERGAPAADGASA